VLKQSTVDRGFTFLTESFQYKSAEFGLEWSRQL